MASITIDNVIKDYGTTRVLHGLNLDIREGEFVSLLGPSGCGKSTLLFCVAGLEPISEGQIRFDGTDMAQRSSRDRNIALVFQDYALYPHMSVRENIAFPLKRLKVDSSTIEAQVKWAAETLGLSALLDRAPSDLSGGQRQRVAVGRAIVRNPAALLMDEPLSNLDASLRVHMRTEIKRLARDLGLTVLFVTHDQEEAMVMSDRIAVLSNGYLQQFAEPMEVYRNPANRFVAEFIGSPKMNLLPASDGKVLMGLRPQDLTPANAADAPDAYAVTGNVALIEPAGPHYFLDVMVNGQMIKATANEIDGLGQGSQVKLTAPSHRVYRFDSDSGVAL
ncbi:ABC transporter ATP-binding protein [Psychromarinibacter sp. S121]|uniref:ABC transporter ATP-binding protein n=1 Tax=Psychromarinibacter sp. S121 TaxID=3415127 RepID=UPI003C7D8E4E